MKKEDYSCFFNSRDGKVNVMLLVSIVLIFVIVSLSFVIESLPVSAKINITQVAPGNLTMNGSRMINFTFFVNYNNESGDIASGGNQIANCSIWTNITGTWQMEAVNNSGAGTGNISNSTLTPSWINLTFTRDGNFSWGVLCVNATGNFTGDINAANFSTNRTLLIDNSSPIVSGTYPAAVFGPGLWANYTSFPININVTVLDNTTSSVWYIINSLPNGAGANETRGTALKHNTTMTLGVIDTNTGNATWRANISLNNFTGNYSETWRGPGAHSIFFCANDTLRRTTCAGPYDFVVSGMNITIIEEMITQFGFTPPGATSPTKIELNITYGNGTDIPVDDPFINPLSQNLTMVFNFSNKYVHIIGMQIDENVMSNASRSNFSQAITPAITSAVGTGFNTTMMWGDLKNFVPNFATYLFGVIQIGGVGYNKHLYCNGTSPDNPNCVSIGTCNATVFSVLNTSTINNVIPTTEPRACWLEGDKVTINDVAGTAGYTYTFVRKFSGAAGGNDTGAPEFQFFGSLVNNDTTRDRHNVPVDDVSIYNTTSPFIVINFTVADINSTGLNMSINGTINVTIRTLGTTPGTSGERIYYSGIGRNLTCVPVGLATNTSVQNITGVDVSGNLTDGVNCTVTITGLRNGTHNITFQARDTSNNSNLNITSLLMTVDQIPPRFVYYNITNGSANLTGVSADTNVTQLGLGDDNSTAQGKIIYAAANWTDNLSMVLAGVLQFHNHSTNTWSDLSVTGAGYKAHRNSSWTNFTFTIPQGHNEFEGRNVSFRIIANDTLGNVNSSSGSVLNFTIQINDTTIPRVSINGTIAVNGTNLSATSVSVVSWIVDDNSRISEITVSVDDAFNDVDGCSKVKNFTTAAGPNNVDSFLNASFSTSSVAGCTLLNGTHNITVRALDVWGNKVAHIHQFTVQTGVVPGLRFNSVRSSIRTPTGISAVNNTNITSSYGLNFSSVTGDIGVANFTYVSSCNTSATRVTLQEAVSNSTVIYPFNESTCPTTSGNRTITLTVTDTAGNSNTTVFGFTVDNVAPTIGVHFPIEGASINGKLDINVSALDTESQVDTIGYYLDDSGALSNHTIRNNNIIINSTSINGTRLSDIGSNTSIINRTTNLTSGTHKIKISVNDTLGNVKNSSVITFTVLGPLDFPSFGFNATNGTSNLSVYNTNISLTNLTNASGQPIEDIRTVTDQTLNLFIALNATRKGVNVTITFNASAANWDRRLFSVIQNETRSFNGITVNWTATIVDFIFINNSIQDFLSDNNSYFGAIDYPINISNSSIGGIFKLLYFSDIRDYTTGINITECSSGFTPTPQTALSAGTFPCWNNSNNSRSIRIFVPHFSIIAAVNDSDAPTLNVTTPNLDSGNATLSMFVPNITTSQDAVSCKYSINESVANVTMTKSGTVCLGQTERFRNTNTSNLTGIAGGAAYNITFYVTDASGNVNTYRLKFNVTDTVAPNTPNSTRVSSSVSTTTATVTVSGMNETVNVTVFYGSVIGTLTSTAVQTDFNTSQEVSLSGLSASTQYHFNVTICDFNGNCAKNGTFNLTTSAAAAEAAAAAAATTGGGGGAAAPSNVESSAGRQWDSLAAGSSGVLTISNEKIAITGVVIDVKNAVTNPSITVESLTSNPLSTAAAAKVYQYLQLKRGNIADSDTSKITINFRLPKSWLTSNGVTEDDIVLYRYSDGKWNALPTTKTGADANNVLYQSTTPGFSTFAIGGKEAAPVVTPPEVTPPTPEVTPPEVTPPTPEEKKPVAPEVKKGLSRTAIAWIVVAIIVIVAAVGYYMWQKKKSEY